MYFRPVLHDMTTAAWRAQLVGLDFHPQRIDSFLRRPSNDTATSLLKSKKDSLGSSHDGVRSTGAYKHMYLYSEGHKSRGMSLTQ